MSKHLTRIQNMKQKLDLTVNTTNDETNNTTNFMDDMYTALKKQNDERIKEGLQPSKTFVFKRIMNRDTKN